MKIVLIFCFLFQTLLLPFSDLILTSISQKANLLDSFVITYATIVASLYRLIGIEFGKQKCDNRNCT